jgi:chromate transporter
MVLGLSAAYVRFGGLPWMQGMFYGIGAAVIGIITRSAFKLTKLTLGKDKLLWAIFAILAVSTAWTSQEIIWLFLLGGVANLSAKALPTRLPARSTVSLFFAPGTLATFASTKGRSRKVDEDRRLGSSFSEADSLLCPSSMVEWCKGTIG